MIIELKKGASIEEFEEVNQFLSNLLSRKKLDAKRFCGVIKLNEDPLVNQKRLRNEWE